MSEALHTAARRYCLEQFARWAEVYTRFPYAGGPYSDGALDVFPRYQQLEAIQLAVERFVPADLGALEDARAMLIEVADAARSPFLANTADPIALRAAADERAKFAAYLTDLDAFAPVPPLPFRRVLSDDDTAALLARIEARYGHWYGGVPDRTGIPPYLTLHVPLDPHPTAVLRSVLRDRAPRLWEINELDPSFEIDLDLVTFTASESHVVPSDLSFLIYSSHEDTLTIAGQELVDAVGAAAPAWASRGAFSTS